MALIKDDIEIPTDALGITYGNIDSNEGWKMHRLISDNKTQNTCNHF